MVSPQEGNNKRFPWGWRSRKERIRDVLAFWLALQSVKYVSILSSSFPRSSSDRDLVGFPYGLRNCLHDDFTGPFDDKHHWHVDRGFYQLPIKLSVWTATALLHGETINCNRTWDAGEELAWKPDTYWRGPAQSSTSMHKVLGGISIFALN